MAGKGKGWHGDSRLHSLARKGISTNIDGNKRFAVNNFVARGKHKLPEVNVSYSDWSIKINPDGTMKLSMGNLTTAGWYWTGEESDLGIFLMRMMNSSDQEQFIKDMEEEGITFEMLQPILIEHINDGDGNGMYSLTGDNARWKFGQGWDMDEDEELEYYSEQYELSEGDLEEIKNELWIYGKWDNINIDKFEETELYQELKKKLIHEIKTSADFEDYAINIKNLKEDVFHDMIEHDTEANSEQLGMAFDRWIGKKKDEGRVIKKINQKASGQTRNVGTHATSQNKFKASGYKVHMSDLTRLVAEANKNYGRNYQLGGSYGNQELWEDGNRLEVGSKKDIHEFLVKNRFKEKMK